MDITSTGKEKAAAFSLAECLPLFFRREQAVWHILNGYALTADKYHFHAVTVCVSLPKSLWDNTVLSVGYAILQFSEPFCFHPLSVCCWCRQSYHPIAGSATAIEPWTITAPVKEKTHLNTVQHQTKIAAALYRSIGVRFGVFRKWKYQISGGCYAHIKRSA